MTTLGKILVFFVLLFSLAVGALVIVDYTARTHWAEAYRDLEKNYAASEASNKAYQAENQKLAVANEGQLKDLAAQLRKVQAELKGAQDANTQLRADLDTEKRRNQRQEAVATSAQEETKLRQSDVEKVRETLKAETDRNVKLVEDNTKLRDRAVAAEIQFKSVEERNIRLEAQLRDANRELARLGSSGGGGSRPGRSMPSEQVEGEVRATDPSGLVTISIGSDAGVTRGNTLYVFRLRPTPRYLGEIRILEATPHQAVGQPVGRMVSPPQVGDRVASRIVGG